MSVDINDPYHRPLYGNEFLAFYQDLSTIMSTTGHLRINIYNDPSGNSFALDNANNPIQDRLVMYIMYTYSNAEISSSESTDGGIQLFFMDGTNIQFPNSETLIFHWYTITGIEPVVIKAFT